MNFKLFSLTVILFTAAAFAGTDSIIDNNRAFKIEYKKGLPAGAYSPSLPLVTTDGEQVLLSKITEPISIVVFVSADDPDCCQINSQLSSIAAKFSDEFVSVIQISMPNETTPEGSACVEICNPFDKNLIVLNDKHGIAWKGYRYPDTETVFLVDDDNKVIAVEELDQLKEIEQKAESINEKLRDQFDEAFLG